MHSAFSKRFRPNLGIIALTASIGSGLLPLLSATSAHAGPLTQTVVVPSALTNTDGSGQYGLGANLTAQQLISSSLLTSVPVGASITGVSFRLNGGQSTNSSAITFANFDIRLGGSNVSSLASGQSFVANEASDTVLARSGSLTFAANAFPGGATPNAFGPTITFTTPYTYTGGNLLFTFSSGSSDGGILIDQDTTSASAGNDYMQGSGYNASTSFTRADSYSVIPRFQFTGGNTAAAPEPGSIGLLAFALTSGLPVVGMVARRRRS